MCGISKSVRFVARAFKTENRGVGRLRRGHILARGLAEFFGRLCDVEDVVDYLKSETERLPEIGEIFQACRGGVSAHRAESDACREQRRGLAAMDVFQFRATDLFALAFEVRDL